MIQKWFIKNKKQTNMKQIEYWGLSFLLITIGDIIMVLNKIPAGWINDGINVIICLILNQIIWNKINKKQI